MIYDKSSAVSSVALFGERYSKLPEKNVVKQCPLWLGFSQTVKTQALRKVDEKCSTFRYFFQGCWKVKFLEFLRMRHAKSHEFCTFCLETQAFQPKLQSSFLMHSSKLTIADSQPRCNVCSSSSLKADIWISWPRKKKLIPFCTYRKSLSRGVVPDFTCLAVRMHSVQLIILPRGWLTTSATVNSIVASSDLHLVGSDDSRWWCPSCWPHV